MSENSIKTVYTCPLGHSCERIVGDTIHKCMWLVKISGKNPQSEEIVDRQECAITSLTMLSLENTQAIRGTTATVESLREETIKRQNIALQVLSENVKLDKS